MARSASGKASEEQRGDGDVVDQMFEDMARAEGWEGVDVEVQIEWGSGLLLARRR